MQAARAASSPKLKPAHSTRLDGKAHSGRADGERVAVSLAVRIARSPSDLVHDDNRPLRRRVVSQIGSNPAMDDSDRGGDDPTVTALDDAVLHSAYVLAQQDGAKLIKPGATALLATGGVPGWDCHLPFPIGR